MKEQATTPSWKRGWLLSLLSAFSVASYAQTGTNVSLPNVVASCSTPDCSDAVVPVDWTNVVEVVANGGLSPGELALRPNGTVAAWGSWTQIPPGLTNVVAISAQLGAGLALKADGTVVSWGGFDNPVDDARFEAGLSNIVAVAAGYSHRLALRADGTVAVWGWDYAASLSVVPAGLTNIISIASGVNHCLALKADGTVVAWGPDFSGECDVPPGLSRVVAIAGGINHSLALKADRTVVAWGDTYNGEISVPPGLGPVEAIAAGSIFSLALKADGSLAGWGLLCPTNGLWGRFTNVAAIAASGNQWVGLLGSGPVFLTSPLVNRTVAQGSTVDLAMTAVGAPPLIYQWRLNKVDLPGATNRVLTLPSIRADQAGAYSVVVSNAFGAVESAPGLVTVPGLAITVQPKGQQCFIGANLVLTVAAAGTPPIAYQWQFNGVDMPGCTANSLSLTNVQLAQAGTYTVVVSNPSGKVGSEPALVYVSQYQVAGWGTNVVWTSDVPKDMDLVALSVGAYYYLALKADGTTVAWGPNGQAMAPPAGAANLVAIASGGSHNLGLKADGTLVGWGLGSPVDTSLVAGLSNIIAIAAGYAHSLALRADGTVATWSTSDSSLETVPVELTNVVAIAGGMAHSLAVRGDGTVVGWGDDTYGQVDVPEDLTNVVAVAAGYNHSLALKADGTIVAWGRDEEGETEVPAGLTNVVAISGGGNHSLALLADNTVVAWGQPGSAWSEVPAGLANVVAIAAGQGCSVVLLGSGPPFLTSQIASRTVSQGASANLRVSASGGLPLNYQWQFNGADLAGATRQVLSLPNIQPDQAGAYSVLVTNTHGAVASGAKAMVRLSKPLTPGGSVPNFVPGSLFCRPDGSFQFALYVAAGSRLEILVSANLRDWTSLATLDPTNSQIPFVDATTNSARRFYRTRLLP